MAKPILNEYQKGLIKDNLPYLMKPIGLVGAIIAQWNLEHIGWKVEEVTDYEQRPAGKRPEIEQLPDGTTKMKWVTVYEDVPVIRKKIKFTRLTTPETSDLENTSLSVPLLSLLYRTGDFGLDTAEGISKAVGDLFGMLGGLGVPNPFFPIPMELLR